MGSTERDIDKQAICNDLKGNADKAKLESDIKKYLEDYKKEHQTDDPNGTNAWKALLQDMQCGDASNSGKSYLPDLLLVEYKDSAVETKDKLTLVTQNSEDPVAAAMAQIFLHYFDQIETADNGKWNMRAGQTDGNAGFEAIQSWAATHDHCTTLQDGTVIFTDDQNHVTAIERHGPNGDSLTSFVYQGDKLIEWTDANGMQHVRQGDKWSTYDKDGKEIASNLTSSPADPLPSTDGSFTWSDSSGNYQAWGRDGSYRFRTDKGVIETHSALGELTEVETGTTAIFYQNGQVNLVKSLVDGSYWSYDTTDDGSGWRHHNKDNSVDGSKYHFADLLGDPKTGVVGDPFSASNDLVFQYRGDASTATYRADGTIQLEYKPSGEILHFDSKGRLDGAIFPAPPPDGIRWEKLDGLWECSNEQINYLDSVTDLSARFDGSVQITHRDGTSSTFHFNADKSFTVDYSNTFSQSGLTSTETLTVECGADGNPRNIKLPDGTFLNYYPNEQPSWLHEDKHSAISVEGQLVHSGNRLGDFSGTPVLRADGVLSFDNSTDLQNSGRSFFSYTSGVWSLPGAQSRELHYPNGSYVVQSLLNGTALELHQPGLTVTHLNNGQIDASTVFTLADKSTIVCKDNKWYHIANDGTQQEVLAPQLDASNNVIQRGAIDLNLGPGERGAYTIFAVGGAAETFDSNGKLTRVASQGTTLDYSDVNGKRVITAISHLNGEQWKLENGMWNHYLSGIKDTNQKVVAELLGGDVDPFSTCTQLRLVFKDGTSEAFLADGTIDSSKDWSITRQDGTIEQHHADGSWQLVKPQTELQLNTGVDSPGLVLELHKPDQSTVKYNASGQIVEIDGPDGKPRAVLNTDTPYFTDGSEHTWFSDKEHPGSWKEYRVNGDIPVETGNSAIVTFLPDGTIKEQAADGLAYKLLKTDGSCETVTSTVMPNGVRIFQNDMHPPQIRDVVMTTQPSETIHYDYDITGQLTKTTFFKADGTPDADKNAKLAELLKQPGAKMSLDSRGNLTITHDGGKDIYDKNITLSTVFRTNGSEIEAINSHVTQIQYADGTSEKFDWNSYSQDASEDWVTSYTDRKQHVWQWCGTEMVCTELNLTSPIQSSVNMEGLVTTGSPYKNDANYSITSSIDGWTVKTSFPGNDLVDVTYSNGKTFQIAKDSLGRDTCTLPDGKLLILDPTDHKWHLGSIQQDRGNTVETAEIYADGIMFCPDGKIIISRPASAIDSNLALIDTYFPTGSGVPVETSSTHYLSLGSDSAAIEARVKLIHDNLNDYSKVSSLLDGLTIADRIALAAKYERDYRESLPGLFAGSLDKNSPYLEALLSQTGDGNKSGAAEDLTLDAGEVRRAFALLASPYDNDRQHAELELRTVIGLLTADQIKKLDADLPGLLTAIRNDARISEATKAAIELLIKGTDNNYITINGVSVLKDSVATQLIEIALKGKDSELFAETMSKASESVRKLYLEPDNVARLKGAFGEDQIINDYVQKGEIQLASLVRVNGNAEAVTAYLLNAPADQRALYSEGYKLYAQGITEGRTPEEKQALEYYTNLHAALNSAATVFLAYYPNQIKQWEAQLLYGSDNFVNQLIVQTGFGYDQNNFMKSIESLSENDLKKLCTDPVYYQLLKDTLPTIMPDSAQVAEAMNIIDSKIQAYKPGMQLQSIEDQVQQLFKRMFNIVVPEIPINPYEQSKLVKRDLVDCIHDSHGNLGAVIDSIQAMSPGDLNMLTTSSGDVIPAGYILENPDQFKNMSYLDAVKAQLKSTLSGDDYNAAMAVLDAKIHGTTLDAWTQLKVDSQANRPSSVIIQDIEKFLADPNTRAHLTVEQRQFIVERLRGALNSVGLDVWHHFVTGEDSLSQAQRALFATGRLPLTFELSFKDSPEAKMQAILQASAVERNELFRYARTLPSGSSEDPYRGLTTDQKNFVFDIVQAHSGQDAITLSSAESLRLALLTNDLTLFSSILDGMPSMMDKQLAIAAYAKEFTGHDLKNDLMTVIGDKPADKAKYAAMVDAIQVASPREYIYNALQEMFIIDNGALARSVSERFGSQMGYTELLKGFLDKLSDAQLQELYNKSLELTQNWADGKIRMDQAVKEMVTTIVGMGAAMGFTIVTGGLGSLALPEIAAALASAFMFGGAMNVTMDKVLLGEQNNPSAEGFIAGGFQFALNFIGPDVFAGILHIPGGLGSLVAEDAGQALSSTLKLTLDSAIQREINSEIQEVAIEAVLKGGGKVLPADKTLDAIVDRLLAAGATVDRNTIKSMLISEINQQVDDKIGALGGKLIEKSIMAVIGGSGGAGSAMIDQSFHLRSDIPILQQFVDAGLSGFVNGVKGIIIFDAGMTAGREALGFVTRTAGGLFARFNRPVMIEDPITGQRYMFTEGTLPENAIILDSSGKPLQQVGLSDLPVYKVNQEGDRFFLPDDQGGQTEIHFNKDSNRWETTSGKPVDAILQMPDGKFVGPGVEGPQSSTSTKLELANKFQQDEINNISFNKKTSSGAQQYTAIIDGVPVLLTEVRVKIGYDPIDAAPALRLRNELAAQAISSEIGFDYPATAMRTIQLADGPHTVLVQELLPGSTLKELLAATNPATGNPWTVPEFVAKYQSQLIESEVQEIVLGLYDANNSNKILSNGQIYNIDMDYAFLPGGDARPQIFSEDPNFHALYETLSGKPIPPEIVGKLKGFVEKYVNSDGSFKADAVRELMQRTGLTQAEAESAIKRAQSLIAGTPPQLPPPKYYYLDNQGNYAGPQYEAVKSNGIAEIPLPIASGTHPLQPNITAAIQNSIAQLEQHEQALIRDSGVRFGDAADAPASLLDSVAPGKNGKTFRELMADPSEGKAFFDPETNTIYINSAATPEQVLQTMGHEFWHVINNKLGNFADSPAMMKVWSRDVILADRAASAYENWHENPEGGRQEAFTMSAEILKKLSGGMTVDQLSPAEREFYKNFSKTIDTVAQYLYAEGLLKTAPWELPINSTATETNPHPNIVGEFTADKNGKIAPADALGPQGKPMIAVAADKSAPQQIESTQTNDGTHLFYVSDPTGQKIEIYYDQLLNRWQTATGEPLTFDTMLDGVVYSGNKSFANHPIESFKLGSISSHGSVDIWVDNDGRAWFSSNDKYWSWTDEDSRVGRMHPSYEATVDSKGNQFIIEQSEYFRRSRNNDTIWSEHWNENVWDPDVAQKSFRSGSVWIEPDGTTWVFNAADGTFESGGRKRFLDLGDHSKIYEYNETEKLFVAADGSTYDQQKNGRFWSYPDGRKVWSSGDGKYFEIDGTGKLLVRDAETGTWHDATSSNLSSSVQTILERYQRGEANLVELIDTAKAENLTSSPDLLLVCESLIKNSSLQEKQAVADYLRTNILNCKDLTKIPYLTDLALTLGSTEQQLTDTRIWEPINAYLKNNPATNDFQQALTFEIIKSIYKVDPLALDQTVLWNTLQKQILRSTTDLEQISQIISEIVAVKPSIVDSSAMKTLFIDPLVARASDTHVSIDERLDLAGWLAREKRNGTFGDAVILIPSIKYPAIDLGLNTDIYRATAQNTLLHGDVATLLGDGILGQEFPKIFGDHTDGGIVGRVQHSAHDFTVDVHTLKIIDGIRNDPGFASLPQEQQVDLLWATLLHDVGKSEGAVDRNQAMKSEAMAWQVLKSLGYSDQRCQAIMDLIYYHDQLGFADDNGVQNITKITDPSYLNNLAVASRNPYFLQQNYLLNIHDMDSVIANPANSWLTPETEQVVVQILNEVATNMQNLERGTLPLLTTDVGSGPLFRTLNYDALWIHKPRNIDLFLDQLGVIESRQFTMSLTEVTPKFSTLFQAAADEPVLVAIVSASPSHIGGGLNFDIGSGIEKGWDEFVKFVSDFGQGSTPEAEFLDEISQKLATLKDKQGQPLTRQELWQHVAKYDSIDALKAAVANGQEDPVYLQGLQMSIDAFTVTKYNDTNELVVNNVIVSGIGIYTRGHPIYLQGATEADLVKLGLNKDNLPPYVYISNPPDKALVISDHTWQTAISKHLPLIVLDAETQSSK